MQAPPSQRESSLCPACWESSRCLSCCLRPCAAVEQPASSMQASSLGVVPASSWSSNWLLTILVLGQPLGPWTPWCPCNRLSGLLATATWRSQASFWYIHIPSLSCVEVPVFWCCPWKQNLDSFPVILCLSISLFPRLPALFWRKNGGMSSSRVGKRQLKSNCARTIWLSCCILIWCLIPGNCCIGLEFKKFFSAKRFYSSVLSALQRKRLRWWFWMIEEIYYKVGHGPGQCEPSSADSNGAVLFERCSGIEISQNRSMGRQIRGARAAGPVLLRDHTVCPESRAGQLHWLHCEWVKIQIIITFGAKDSHLTVCQQGTPGHASGVQINDDCIEPGILWLWMSENTDYHCLYITESNLNISVWVISLLIIEGIQKGVSSCWRDHSDVIIFMKCK
jgi:hypothetical protein